MAPGHTAYAGVDLVLLDQIPVVMELELIEPALFLGQSANVASRFASVLTDHLAGSNSTPADSVITACPRLELALRNPQRFEWRPSAAREVPLIELYSNLVVP